MDAIKHLQFGNIRYVVFQEEEEWYAAALELNIVETGSTPQEALLLLFDAVKGYMETVQKTSATHLLQQDIDPEYERIWQQATQKVPLAVSEKVFTVGQLAMA